MSTSGQELGNITGQSIIQYPPTVHFYAQFKLATGEIREDIGPEIPSDTGAATLSKDKIRGILYKYGCSKFNCPVEVLDFRWAYLLKHEAFELANSGIDVYNNQPPPNQSLPNQQYGQQYGQHYQSNNDSMDFA